MSKFKTLDEAQQAFDKMKARVEKLEEKLKTKSQLELGRDKGGLLDLASVIPERMDLIEKSINSLSLAGATFASGGTLERALGDSVATLDKLIASGADADNAFQALTNSFEQFNALSKLVGETSRNLAGDLTSQAALLQRLGLSYGDFSKNIDLAIFSFSQTAKGVSDINLQIKDLSDRMGMLPSVVSRNFQSVAKNLAYSFDDIKDQFVGLQQMANKTGVSVDALMGKFGRPMDTISGASQMAAKLNALLGRNAFSATELLMMDEKTRAETIRTALQGSGATAQALSGGVAGKFALQSIQEVLGMDLDETRRFISGGGPGSVKAQMAGKTTAGEVDTMKENFKDPAGKLSEALKGLQNTILQTQASVFNRIAIRVRQRAIEGVTPEFQGVSQPARVLRTGLLGKGRTEEEYQKAALKDPNMFRVLAQYKQYGAINEKDFNELVDEINKGTDDTVLEQKLKTVLDTTGLTATKISGSKLLDKAGEGQQIRILRNLKAGGSADAPDKDYDDTANDIKIIQNRDASQEERDKALERLRKREGGKPETKFDEETKRNATSPSINLASTVQILLDGKMIAENTSNHQTGRAASPVVPAVIRTTVTG